LRDERSFHDNGGQKFFWAFFICSKPKRLIMPTHVNAFKHVILILGGFKMKSNTMKIIGLMMALMMALFAFAGCGSTTNQSGTDADATPAATESASEAPSEAASQEPASDEMFTIGITQIVDHPSLDVCREGAIEKLAELGYVEGENLKINYQSAQGDTATATSIAQQFVSDNVDLIIAIATPSAQASYAAAMEKGIPVVFSAVSEPGAAGLANEDGTNIAGVTGTSDKLPVSATFDLIKKLTPDAVKIGILHNTAEVNSDVQLAEAQALAGEYGMEVLDKGITSTNEIASALDALLPEVDVIMNLTDNMVVSSLPLVVQKCNEAKVPLYGSEDTQVSNGALASAGVDYHALGLLTGEMAAKILEGAAAETLAFETLKTPKLIVNSDQLELLGLTVPDDFKDSVELVTTATDEEA
jgi:putative ABC transport system substrate-binding protein